MRNILTLISALCLTFLVTAHAQAETTTPQKAAYFVGETVTVEGVVSQVSTGKSGAIFINFGGRFPNHVFYGVIFRQNTGKFSGIRSLEGKLVGITGTIKLYKGKPQIILQSPKQIATKN